MIRALRERWPEYLIEAALLGAFMLSACLCTAFFYHPGSLAIEWVPSTGFRHLLLSCAMGVTAIGLIYSPWGQRSGAHMNPAVTLAFLRLGTIRPVDAACYVVAHFAGGLSGVLLAKALLGPVIDHPAVNYAVTIPGPAGPFAAFVAETAISGAMMLMVLFASNSTRFKPYTGVLAGILVATFIMFEAPFSGMSMNPARTTASAVPSGVWTTIWLYCTAPVIGMMAAAQIFLSARVHRELACPKLLHGSTQRCIFCGYKSTPRITSCKAELVTATH